MTLRSCSTPMKSSSLASVWTEPDSLFQSVSISHSLCHHSHHSCCFPPGLLLLCIHVLWAGEPKEEVLLQLYPWHCWVLLNHYLAWLAAYTHVLFFTHKNMMLIWQIWAHSILFKFPFFCLNFLCRILILFLIFCNTVVQL